MAQNLYSSPNTDNIYIFRFSTISRLSPIYRRPSHLFTNRCSWGLQILLFTEKSDGNLIKIHHGLELQLQVAN